MGKPTPQYTDQQLYGANGQPLLVHVDQDKIFDCYLVSSMGALAAQQPDRIRDAIRYEPDPDNPNTGVFHVSLHHPTRGPIEVPVTQADVEFNIQKGGGGTADNKKGSPIWPSVMEAAFAKLHDPNPQNNDRKEAYDVIGNETRGGSLHEAMFALTGDAGHNLRYTNSPKGHSGPSGGSNKDERPSFDVPLKSENVSRFDDAHGAYAKINEALGAGNAVTLSTRSADVNDGVMKHHAYIVTGIEQREKKDGSNEVFVTLRNPYAHNNNTPSENKDTSKPSITVSLDKILKEEVFGEFNIGPAPRVKTQQPLQRGEPEQTTPMPNKNETLNKSAELSHPNNSNHSLHAIFNQAFRLIDKEDGKLGRTPDEKSERLALALTTLAANSGMTRIDHLVFSKEDKERGIRAGENVIIVQGGFNDPAHDRAHMKTEAAINMPIEQSIKQMSVIHQQQTQEAQSMAMQRTQTVNQDSPVQRMSQIG